MTDRDRLELAQDVIDEAETADRMTAPHGNLSVDRRRLELAHALQDCEEDLRVEREEDKAIIGRLRKRITAEQLCFTEMRADLETALKDCERGAWPQHEEPWDGERCQVCGRSYATVYRVPDDVWTRISPKGNEGGLLCPPCAARRAHEAGISLWWEAAVGDFPSAAEQRVKELEAEIEAKEKWLRGLFRTSAAAKADAARLSASPPLEESG